MDSLIVNNWKSSSGTLYAAPLQFQYVNIPYSTGSATLGYTSTLAGYTTSNTALLYSFTFTPVSTSSYIMWMMAIDCDRSNNTAQEHICMFINGTPYSSSYLYPRNSGNEPYQHIQSGTYTNSSTAAKTFAIQGASGLAWTQYIGKSSGTGNQMSNCILIFEYPR